MGIERFVPCLRIARKHLSGRHPRVLQISWVRASLDKNVSGHGHHLERIRYLDCNGLEYIVSMCYTGVFDRSPGFP